MVENTIPLRSQQERRSLRKRPQGIKLQLGSAPKLPDSSGAVSNYLSSCPVHDLLRIEESLGSVSLTQGSFASVRAVTEVSTGRRFAAKIVVEHEGGYIQKAVREYEILADLNHANIVKVVRMLVDDSAKKTYMLMPVYAYPTLEFVISRSGPVSLEEVRVMAKGLFDALAYLHRKNVIHRDINPNNVLYSPGHPLLIDFNTARRLLPGQCLAVPVGTRYFKPPEMKAELPYDHKADVWSLAATLVKALGRSTDEDWQDLDANTVDFFSKTLSRRPELRLSAQEACNHRWLL